MYKLLECSPNFPSGLLRQVVYWVYEIAMVLYFLDQVAYSHQINVMMRQTNQSDSKNERSDSAPDTKEAEQSDENISR